MSRDDVEKMFVGDSASNRAPAELKGRSSNHVFDGAGENVHYHSDTESLGSRKSKTRYINPAITIEPVEASHSATSLLTEGSSVDNVTPHPHTTYCSNSTPTLSRRESNASIGSVKRISCRLADAPHTETDDATPRNLNGLNNLNSATYRDGTTYRDGNTYREGHAFGDASYADGSDTFRLSVASLSTTATAKEERERNERKKQEAFRQWLARKEQEKKEKARLEKLKRQAVNMPTPAQREEAFQRWCERKREEQEHKKAEEIMRRYREHERMEFERNQRLRNKEEKLAEWIKKKEEEMKAMKTKEERRIARAAIEEQRRRVAGERAYRDWLRTSKNKPLPVPLNQGELSMRGSMSNMYINPNPWQAPT